jgi:hypothetical protein
MPGSRAPQRRTSRPETRARLHALLEPPRIPAVSRNDALVVALGATFILLSWLTSTRTWLSNLLGGCGLLLIGVTVGSTVRNGRWRALLGRQRIDPHAVVFVDRQTYPNILKSISSADRAVILGFHLEYLIGWLDANHTKFFKRVSHLTILLPSWRSFCDERDKSQDTGVGELWADLVKHGPQLERIRTRHPDQVTISYFTIQPYSSFTLVDDQIWVVPYLTVSGYHSPVLFVTAGRNSELFELFRNHVERLIETAADTPETNPHRNTA